jgi:Domain of unknown function (DUF1707)
MDPTLRAGDGDRRQIVAELQRHFVEGRLTSEELSERVDRALAARTFGELKALTTDLPTPRPAPADHNSQRQDWWAPFVSMPGVLLLAALVVLVVTLLVSLPSGGVVAWPVLILGGFFFIGRPPRLRRRR